MNIGDAELAVLAMPTIIDGGMLFRPVVVQAPMVAPAPADIGPWERWTTHRSVTLSEGCSLVERQDQTGAVEWYVYYRDEDQP